MRLLQNPFPPAARLALLALLAFFAAAPGHAQNLPARASPLGWQSCQAMKGDAAAQLSCFQQWADSQTPANTSTSASMDANDDAVAATVGGETITMAEVDRAAASQLTKVRQQEYDIRKNILQQLVNDTLIAQEAAARKVTP